MCSLQTHSERSTREWEAAKDTPIYEQACDAAGFRPESN